jgi:MinD-like ATPase involved in chromosome partitioning or flagellar assembly
MVDTDIQSPGIHAIFGFDEDSIGHALNDYLWGNCGIADVAHDVTRVLRQAGDVAEGGAAYLVPSSIKAGDIARVLREGYDSELLNEGIETLGEELSLDYVFVDTHPGLNEETLISMSIADNLIIILRPDRQDYQGTSVTVDVAQKLDVPGLLLVVNKVPAALDAAAVRREVEKTYGAPVAGVLPLSEDMVELGSSGLFTLRFPAHPWSTEVQAIARQLTS